MASDETTQDTGSPKAQGNALSTSEFLLLLFPCLIADIIGIIPFLGAVIKWVMNGVLLFVGSMKSASSGRNLGHVLNSGISAGINSTPIPATTASLIVLYMKGRAPALPGTRGK